jgi:HSP20 family protein
MGQGKNFDYRKFLRNLEEFKFREQHLYAERVTAVYGGGMTSTGEWTPAIDVYETKESFFLVAEVAGLSEEDIRIEVAENIVALKGERPFTRKGVSSENYYRMEFSYGSFERSFTLPCAVDALEVKAVLKDGILTVKLPRSDSGRKQTTIIVVK